MVNLIKCGAFDCFGESTAVMRQYIGMVRDQKKRITLQNMKMLIDFGLIPDDYDMERRVYNFNKYLKKFKHGTEYYELDEIAFNFYSQNFDIDKLLQDTNSPSGFSISQTVWEKIYQNHMDKVRPYVKNHNQELLEQVNNKLMADTWNKYCLGSVSKWEMDSISCYLHEHELENVFDDDYGCVNFFKLPDEPIIDRIIPTKDGKKIPLLKISRIMGTVLDKDKNKKTVTLLTKQGVVTVKIWGDVYTHFDKQISEKGADGKKHVIEKSFFSRGNKLIVTGVKTNEATFLAKKYSKTPWHLLERIVEVNEIGEITTQAARYGEEE
jgi:DNA polymerase-3 subunit alpha